MIFPRSSLFVVLFCLAATTISAQPIVVIGGGQNAQECFMNAEMAARNLPGVGRSMLKACDYTLEYSKIGLQDRAATYANRGIVHAAMSNFDAAMADYEAAIAIEPSAPEFYVNRGNSFFMIRDYTRALDDYELSMELGLEQLHFVHYNMGMVFERLGNDEAAERHYQQALDFDPDWNLPKRRLLIVHERLLADMAAGQAP